ncbi:MAG: sulfatase-like hydrolase/transferase [Bryobacterales bacterium]|nr:sulfatase-like hydrolase/transferase [Bryobacterales bacterium]
MKRRDFLAAGLGAGLPAAAPERPNILLFCTDQQRFDTLGALGNPHIRTPNLDRLVSQGVAFTNAYCQTPICTPSRASLLTGCYPSTLHVTRNGNAFFPAHLAPRLISRILQGAGYDCGMVGKFHLSSSYQRVEPRLDDGYRLFEWSHAPRQDWPVEEQGYMRWLRDQGVDFKQAYGARRLPGRPAEFNAGIAARHHEVTWCTGTAASWIRGRLTAPWFITVNTYAPHPPFHPPPEFLEKMNPETMPLPLWGPDEPRNQAHFSKVDFQSRPRDPSTYPSRFMKAAYYAQVEFVDHCFGQVLDALDASGQRDNTLIVFTSDHGEAMGDHGLTHKGCRFYEGLSHVPLVLAWPARWKARRSPALVELTDIVPTLLEAAGIPLPDHLQGMPLSALAAGAARDSAHRVFVRSEYHDALDLPDHTHANMLRNERYKLVHYHGHPAGELYDLEKDPGELRNLWFDPAHAALQRDLTKQLFDAVMLASDPGQPRIGPM